MQIKFAICLEKILKVLGKYSQSSFTSYGIITGPSAEEEPITDRNRTKFEGRASIYILQKSAANILIAAADLHTIPFLAQIVRL